MHTSTSIETRQFDPPDDQLDFGSHGRIDIITLNDGTTGMRAILEPGYRWSIDEKPLLGNPDSCPMEHIGYCVSGELVVRMIETGEERVLSRGDFFEVAPGHDAWVPGDERCELILFKVPRVEEEAERESQPEPEVMPGPPD